MREMMAEMEDPEVQAAMEEIFGDMSQKESERCMGNMIAMLPAEQLRSMEDRMVQEAPISQRSEARRKFREMSGKAKPLGSEQLPVNPERCFRPAATFVPTKPRSRALPLPKKRCAESK